MKKERGRICAASRLCRTLAASSALNRLEDPTGFADVPKIGSDRSEESSCLAADRFAKSEYRRDLLRVVEVAVQMGLLSNVFMPILPRELRDDFNAFLLAAIGVHQNQPMTTLTLSDEATLL